MSRHGNEYLTLWLRMGSVLLWAWLGYMIAKAESGHDVVGYGFGLLFVFLLPAVMVLKMIRDAVER
jgi:hypothetical protein